MSYSQRCEECGERFTAAGAYCPFCGAKQTSVAGDLDA